MKKYVVFGIVLLFIGTSLIPSTGGIRREHNSEIDNKTKVTSDKTSTVNEETEYWALLIAVGVYADHPEKNMLSMLTEVEDLHNMLLVSTHWKEENIKVIKGENATLWNIIKGFQWLNQKEDENDFSLVYIATHGGQLKSDKWPWDEKDRRDEILVTYRGFQYYPLINIRDDFLNLLLCSLDSKGVCVVVDSCYAGGFNDPPYFKPQAKEKEMNADIWMEEFAEDLSRGGRVVLMSCQEDEHAYGPFFFNCLIEGLRGYADTDGDRLVSAEEAYEYVIENLNVPDMHPTIYDGFAGELKLTEVELPPSKPETPIGQTLGDINTTYNYSTVSTDPEGGKICYGWDGDSDYIVDEWTGPVDSNATVNISYSWTVEGTYIIRVIAKDERGVLSDWSNNTVVIMCDDNIPDQQQTNIGGSCNFNKWIAQSFVPSLDTLSKVELVLESWEGSGDPPLLYLYIRDNLSGDDLAESSRVIPIMDYDTYAWFTFDFENLDVVPGETYYIVCEQKDWWPYWLYWHSDCYPSGEMFLSEDGIHWRPFGNPPFDCCFVTWGKI